MARTREQWNTEFNTYAASKGLSSSVAAEWKLLRDVIVTIAILFESILELFKNDVDNSLATKQPGSLAWYPKMIKEFQYGDSLIVADGIAKYAEIVPANRIISQVAVRESSEGTLLIKVAKDSGSNKVKLTNDELTAANNYMRARRAPGVSFSISSLDADVISYYLQGFFDPAYDASELQEALEQVFADFRNDFDFGGVFYKMQLIERLMSVPGMKSIELTIDLTVQTGNPLQPTKDIDNLPYLYELPAGYFNYHEDSVITLKSIS